VTGPGREDPAAPSVPGAPVPGTDGPLMFVKYAYPPNAVLR